MFRNFFFLFLIVSLGIFLRIYYLINKSGNLFIPNLGGDSCYHYNVALNIANGIGPKTNFIFSYWFPHPSLPAYIDLYGPGYSYFLSIFLFFNDNFFNLRIANFILGISSILITYFLGKKIFSKQLGLISSFFIAINFFHIENSTVVMREIFNLVLAQIFFLLLFFVNKKNLLIVFFIGLLSGYISITTGFWLIYFTIFFVYIFIEFKSINLKFIFTYLTGFSLTSINWLLITKNYFGKFYFSNLNYYPYVSDWARMMFDRGLPNIDNFWNEINLKEYIFNHFIWFIKNLYMSSLVLTPTFVFFLFFLLIPLCLFGAYKLKLRGYILIIFSIVYFIGLSYGSYALNGHLWPRHFLPLLSSSTILLAGGLIPFINYIKKKFLYASYKKMIYLIIFFSSIITIVGINIKKSFWEINSSKFYEFGDQIHKVTNNGEVIMYSVAVPDAWCATRRNIVHDISRGGAVSKERLNLEIKKYDVSSIFIDLSRDNYRHSDVELNNLLNNYSGLDLKLILADELNGYFFYKILKN